MTAVLILILGTSAAGMLAEMAGGALSRAGVVRVGGIKSALRYAILVLAAILAAVVLGIDVAILLAVTVIGLEAVALTPSLALGLGLRRLSENAAASRYVSSEGINEGDEISVNGVSGTVERLGQAATIVLGKNGRAYIIPNGYFLQHVVEKTEAAKWDEEP